ncbi:hypothetical protein SBADM41S_10337 [Streptomyces badius]
MPVEFLTDEQAEAYGKFAEEPTCPELERFFFLDDVDRDLIALRRSAHQPAPRSRGEQHGCIGQFLPDDPARCSSWPVAGLPCLRSVGIGAPSVPGAGAHHQRRPLTEVLRLQAGHHLALNAVNDQVAGIGQMVVPGTPRDSLHILDALLNLDGGVKPEMVATDNASYSDMVFGLFKILGYNFSPRFRDLDDQRFWRATMPGVQTGTYSPMEDLARNRVNLNKVITHWPDMLKVAGSLVTNQVRAYDLLRMFGRDGRPHSARAAFAEYGRIARNRAPAAGSRPGRRHLPPADEPAAHRAGVPPQARPRRVPRQTRPIHQAYRDGMEDQLGALGLVLNAIVLWTTRYIDAAVAH